MKFTLNKSFVTVSEPTPRTILVSEAFGLGLDTKREFSIYEDFQIDVRPGDVVFLTGDSGSGKSTLLRSLTEKISNAGIFGSVQDLARIEISEDELLIDNAGATFEESLRNLSFAGLSDAFIFLRKYKELSDGQRYRYRLGKLLSSGARTWVCDEFLATLDRETAQAVSFTLRKSARKLHKTLIVSTTHRDILKDLDPSIIVKKGYGSKCVIEYRNPDSSGCSLLRHITFREGSRADYEQLHQFHYRAELPNSTYRIFALEFNRELVGCIAYGTPPLASAARRTYMGYHVPPEQLNKEFANISRVIIDPKFRSIGLGAKIVRESLPLVEKKFVETTAVMARYNPFFEKAGMKRIISESNSSNEYKIQISKLEELGVSLLDLSKVNSMPNDQYNNVCEYLANNENYFSIASQYGHDAKVDRSKLRDDLFANRKLVKDSISNIAILSQEKAYFVWRNEAIS